MTNKANPSAYPRYAKEAKNLLSVNNIINPTNKETPNQMACFI